MKKKALYVVNDARYFLSHRLPIALAAADAGYEVHVAVPESEFVQKIAAQSFIVHIIHIDRRSLNPLSNLRTMLCLWRLYRSLKPQLVHHLTIKPVIYGSLAARLCKVHAVINAVTGLGYVFVDTNLKSRILRKVVITMYAICLRNENSKLIFQNSDDRNLFIQKGIATETNSILIRGSGVDLQGYSVQEEPSGNIIILLAARMLWSKGVVEFVAAAKQLSNETNFKFVLVGDSDAGNPDAIPKKKLQQWHDEGIIQWWGWQDDMATIFAKCHIVCLPSYYREGVPKVLIEAAACGRPIITTDMPGCRDIVRDEVSGLLIPPKDANALALAIRTLTDNKQMRAAMGQVGRKLVEQEFSVDKVVAETMKVYASL